MAASAGTVTLDLDANSVKLLRELQKSQRATQRTARRMESSMSRSFKAISRAAITAGSALGAAFGARALQEVAQAGIEMQRLERGLRVASGSAEGAAEDLAFLRSEASRLGLDLRTSGQAFTSLAAAAKGTSLEGQAAKDIFTAISEASRVMGLSVEQTGGALTAIEQIISKGKVSAEELRGQLGERLPGAFQIAARSIGVTTSELDNMLRQGKLTAEELLPALAKELRKTFGSEVESAANDAQASFARFQTAIFELKASIAESGILDALASLADGMRGIIAPTDLEKIADIRREIASLKGLPSFDVDVAAQARVRALREELLGIVKAMSEAKNEADRSRFIAGLFVNVDTAVAGATKRLEDFNAETARVRRALDRFHSERETEARLRAAVELVKTASDDLDDFFKDQDSRIVQSATAAFDEIAEASRQAARNIQDTFADFLFDPFEDGLKGMVRGFFDAIRRMLANQAAIQLFGWVKSAFAGGGNPNDPGGHIGAGLNELFPRAHGGPVTAGGGYMVGEDGPEFFSPSRSGVIVPNSKLSSGMSVAITNNVSADGFTEAQLVAALDRNTERTVGRIYELRQKGRL